LRLSRLRSRRHADAGGHRQIDVAGQGLELPLDRGRNVGKAARRRAAQSRHIARQIDQHLGAREEAQPKARVGTVEEMGAVTRREIDAVLALEAPAGDDEARIGDVRPVGDDLGAGFRTARSDSCVACAGNGKRERQGGALPACSSTPSTRSMDSRRHDPRVAQGG